EVRGDHQRGAGVQGCLEGRQGGRDAARVGDGRPVERDVEVAAHEDLAILYAGVEQVGERAHGHGVDSSGSVGVGYVLRARPGDALDVPGPGPTDAAVRSEGSGDLRATCRPGR